jgi:hypothetical protein
MARGRPTACTSISPEDCGRELPLLGGEGWGEGERSTIRTTLQRLTRPFAGRLRSLSLLEASLTSAATTCGGSRTRPGAAQGCLLRSQQLGLRTGKGIGREKAQKTQKHGFFCASCAFSRLCICFLPAVCSVCVRCRRVRQVVPARPRERETFPRSRSRAGASAQFHGLRQDRNARL